MSGTGENEPKLGISQLLVVVGSFLFDIRIHPFFLWGVIAESVAAPRHSDGSRGIIKANQVGKVRVPFSAKVVNVFSDNCPIYVVEQRGHVTSKGREFVEIQAVRECRSNRDRGWFSESRVSCRGRRRGGRLTENVQVPMTVYEKLTAVWTFLFPCSFDNQNHEP